MRPIPLKLTMCPPLAVMDCCSSGSVCSRRCLASVRLLGLEAINRRTGLTSARQGQGWVGHRTIHSNIGVLAATAVILALAAVASWLSDQTVAMVGKRFTRPGIFALECGSATSNVDNHSQ